MNRASWLSVLVVLMCSALFVSLTSTGAQAGFTSVWAVDDGEKIYRDNITSPLKNGNSVWNGSSVSLFGCRNEIVAFQLILQADGSGATNADVQISNLTSGGNTIRGSHPLMAANDYVGMGVELFTEHYLNVSVLSGDADLGHFNWNASAAPWLSGMTTGWMPDALVPFSAASGKGGAPFTIAASKNQGVWVDIYIDKTLPTGTYTGTITIKLNGATHSTIPISLQVLSPTLSDTNHFKSMVFFRLWDALTTRYGLSSGTSAYWDMAKYHYRMAHRHRLDLISHGSWDEINGMPGVLNGSDYALAQGYEGPGEGVGNQVFSVGTYGAWWSQNQSYYETESNAWVNWFSSNAPNVDYFLYLVDEPGPSQYDAVKTRADWIHNNPGPGKDLPLLTTLPVTSDLVGYIDIWCTPEKRWSSASRAAAEARGEQVYSHQDYRPKTPGDLMDEWGIAFRLKPWISHQWSVTRWFTWESSHYQRNPDELNPGSQIDVWTDPLTFHTADPESTGNGDGLLIYPGRDYVFTAQDRNFNGPIASTRLKMYRRGVQDVEYMWLAEQAGKGAQVQNVLQDLLPHTMDSAVTPPDWSNSNAPYDAARRELADLAAGTTRAPSAKFQAAVTHGPAPLAVNFTDLSLFAPTSWSWTFGDGGTSTAQNPSHSYSSLGSYTVSLRAVNAQGQDSEIKRNYISVAQQVTVYPDTWTTSTGWADTGIVSGGLSNLQSDDGSYMVMQPTNAEKRYSVAYTADTVYTPSQVSRIKVEYQAKRSSSTTPGLDWVKVRRSDGNWQFVDDWVPGTTDTNWSWETTVPGAYMSSSGLIGFYLCGCPNGTTSYTISSDLMRFQVELAQSGTLAPIAEFIASPRSGTAPLAVAFADCSSNSPTSWSWNFGDSNTSTAQNPSHTYGSGGNFTVSVRATNANGYDDEVKTNYITVTPLPPVAGFSGTPTTGTAPLNVSFTDSSTNSPTSWSWNFGDSSTSTSQHPSHSYAAGTYTVSLRATNAGGYDDEVKTNYITVTPPPPVAAFTGTPTSGTAPLSVSFTDQSTNTPTSWSWNFGDSSTSTTQSPSHSFAAGTYTVSLRATNAYGYDDEVKTNYITATPPPPVAAFSGTPTSGMAPLAVAFTDSSTNTPTSWSWNFGDSSTSTTQSPSHTYSNAGTYTVSLRATNAGGYDDEVKTNYISATSGGGSMPTFVAAGAVSSNAAAITPALPAGIATNDILLLFVETYNQAVTIANQNGGTWTEVANSPQGTTGTRLTAFWSRYNGTQGAPTTSDSGNHQLGRIVAIRGCATSGNPWDVTAGGVESTSDTSGSIPGATTTVANTLVVTALATDLPDASGTANFSAWSNANLANLAERTDNTVTAGNGGGLAIATGEKATAGTYGNTAVTLATAATKGMMSLALKPSSSSPPVANFTGTPVNGPVSLAVTFTDSSTNTPTSWSWNFGDSSTSTSQNPSHTYTTAGDYTVSLRATNSAGYDDEVKTNYITVSAANEVIVYPDSWAANSYTPGCALQSGALADLRTDNDTYMVIRSDTSTQRYGVLYTADTIYTPAQVSQITYEYQGRVSRSDTPTSGTVFMRKSDGVWEYRSTHWLPGTSDTSYTWSSTAVSTYMDSNGLIGFELCCCPTSGNTNNYDVSSDKMRFRLQLVTVNPPVAAFSGAPTSGTAPLNVAFTDSSTNTPTSWSWNFGDGSTSTSQNPSHSFAVGTYTVSLRATNSAGYDDEVKTSYITVNPVEVYVYPYQWTTWTGMTLQSGSLSDLQTDNNVYMVYLCDPSTEQTQVRYFWDTTYVPSQVSKITVQLQWKGSRADTPYYGLLIWNYATNGYDDLRVRSPWYTTDTDLFWETTNISAYMSANGELLLDYCGCPQNGNSYTTSIDMTRVKLTLN